MPSTRVRGIYLNRNWRYLEGHLPAKAARIVKEWAAEHRAKLFENWTKRVILSHYNVLPELTMIKIVKAEYIDQYRIRLTFSDGQQGEYDLSPFLPKTPN